MLLELHIENILLIEKASIFFNPGFSVIIGETGSGKSVILDCISIVLGDRAKSDLTNDNGGIITAVFDIKNNENVKNILLEHHINHENEIIIKKIISKNGSKIFLNDNPVTVNLISKIATEMIEINSQFVQTELFLQEKHLAILDLFGGINLHYNKLKTLYNNLNDAIKIYDNERLLKESIEKEIEFLKEACEDIKKISLCEGEYDDLILKRIAMQNHVKIANSVQNISKYSENIINNQNLIKIENELDNLSQNNKNIDVLSIISDLKDYIDKISIFKEEVIELSTNLVRKISNNHESIEEIEDRIFAINSLSRKYRIQPFQLLSFYKESVEKIKNFNISEERMQFLKLQIEEKRAEYLQFCTEISILRKNIAQELSKRIIEKISLLGMQNAKIEIKLFENKIHTPLGIDSIVFYASMNPNLPLMPINKIASGGELSRLMLAIKMILSDKLNINTIIFDEIDTGISGKIAHQIGLEMKKMSTKIQILAISHNPQVIAVATNHIFVKKNKEKDKYITTIHKLNKEEKVIILAEMLSNSSVTAESIENARKLLENSSIKN